MVGPRPAANCFLEQWRSTHIVGTTPLVFFIGRTHPRRASSTVAERRRMRHAASPKTHHNTGFLRTARRSGFSGRQDARSAAGSFAHGSHVPAKSGGRAGVLRLRHRRASSGLLPTCSRLHASLGKMARYTPVRALHIVKNRLSGLGRGAGGRTVKLGDETQLCVV
jgi:hypothetical protein